MDSLRLIKHDLTIEEFLKCEAGGLTAEGEPVTFTGADELEAVKANGFWGFCDPQTKTIHVWVGEGTDPEEIIFFLGHEIGHASGTPVEDSGDELKDEMAEQQRADEYGEAARQASKWLKELLPAHFSAS